jgi:hypothetical protein
VTNAHIYDPLGLASEGTKIDFQLQINALFVSGIATNMDAADIRHVVGTAGGQLDFRFTVLSNLDMTLSVGDGVAFEQHQGPRHEVMVSLKVLR